MDLSTFDPAPQADEGADMLLRHPVTDEVVKDKDGSPIVIRLAGRDSSRYRRAFANVGNRRLRKMNKGITVEKSESDFDDIYAKCTLSWKGVEYRGEPLGCNEDNARMLYSEQRWIREQVAEFIEDRANFLTSASTN